MPIITPLTKNIKDYSLYYIIGGIILLLISLIFSNPQAREIIKEYCSGWYNKVDEEHKEKINDFKDKIL
jgi:hypothetical protein